MTAKTSFADECAEKQSQALEKDDEFTLRFICQRQKTDKKGEEKT